MRSTVNLHLNPTGSVEETSFPIRETPLKTKVSNDLFLGHFPVACHMDLCNCLCFWHQGWDQGWEHGPQELQTGCQVFPSTSRFRSRQSWLPHRGWGFFTGFCLLRVHWNHRSRADQLLLVRSTHGQDGKIPVVPGAVSPRWDDFGVFPD